MRDGHFCEITERKCVMINEDLSIPGRPLLGKIIIVKQDGGKIYEPKLRCSVPNLMEQLQTAVQLEWFIITAYLNVYYSISEGHNLYFKNAIHKIITNKINHMTLAANMLIALNRHPKVNDPAVNPVFPTMGTPGGLLPGLLVELKKLSIEYIHDILMAFEIPVKGKRSKFGDLFTIEAFYNEIKDCIHILERSGVNIFNELTKDVQVKIKNWFPIVDASSAIRAVEVILSQGSDEKREGLLPLGHFLILEEMVCGWKLVTFPNNSFAFLGDEIHFEPQYVWPIHSNFNASLLTPESKCYNEALRFHQTNLELLESLQAAFDGNPKKIGYSIEKMFALTNCAKALVTIKFNDDPGDNTTCGPVWDYHWPQE